MKRLLLLCVLAVSAGCLGGFGGERVARAASHPATLEAPGYTLANASSPSIDATVRASISGDVELQGQQRVNATLAVRRYEGNATVGLVTSPAVRPIENTDTVRDPFATLPVERQVALATGVRAGDGSATTSQVRLLGRNATLTSYGDAHLVRVRHGEDFVTVVVVGERPSQSLLDGVTHEK
ncbi:hypothetical protein [Natronomonas sp. EA1]|uniref:hypothetical protein n=1 Tax=Natronomonas sp. EA1 TaxID=3421655 RepID=UPI003EB9B10E